MKHINLSTPHGALGTLFIHALYEAMQLLSTPHGALGTLRVLQGVNLDVGGFQLHTVH